MCFLSLWQLLHGKGLESWKPDRIWCWLLVPWVTEVRFNAKWHVAQTHDTVTVSFCSLATSWTVLSKLRFSILCYAMTLIYIFKANVQCKCHAHLLCQPACVLCHLQNGLTHFEEMLYVWCAFRISERIWFWSASTIVTPTLRKAKIKRYRMSKNGWSHEEYYVVLNTDTIKICNLNLKHSSAL
jgi:hypothetical protein